MMLQNHFDYVKHIVIFWATEFYAYALSSIRHILLAILGKEEIWICEHIVIFWATELYTWVPNTH